MTTDDFTTAAREAAQDASEKWFDDDMGFVGFDLGTEWARTHLEAQEPTEAEVEAAARALAYCDGADGWGTPGWTGDIPEVAYRNGARRALLAARAAGSQS